MALAVAEEEETLALRERRCIVTGEIRAESELIRFVADPEGRVVPDLAAKLPGRGLWVTATREMVERAVAKNAFSRAAKTPLQATADLAERVEMLLIQQIANKLGLARRAGMVVLGFDSIVRAFEVKNPPRILVEARDGAADGRRKLLAAARQNDLNLRVMDFLTTAELSLALGRENVIHAGLRPGLQAERILFDAGRLSGFRSGGQDTGAVGTEPAILKDRHERDE